MAQVAAVGNTKGILLCLIRKGATQRAVPPTAAPTTSSPLSECPNCHEKKLPHRACPKCGAYKGRAVLDIKEAAK